jgi:oligo-alginate lyase
MWLKNFPPLFFHVYFILIFTGLNVEIISSEPLQSQFPPKTQRTLLSEQQIQLAHRNCSSYPSARKLANNIKKRADYWLSWSDKELSQLISSEKVPRAYNVGTDGCPIHGKKVYEYGTYPWIIDPKLPYKIKCPVGGEIYPDNDFVSYYKSGLRDKRYLAGQYSDDGWGWTGANGKRYWFVAYANHWIWRNHILYGLRKLSRAYILSGNKLYAHKAAVLLDSIAEIYPAMDYRNQSRSGLLAKNADKFYGGKIVNHIWESFALRDMAESYDAIWETIDSDYELHRFTGKNGRQIRADIESNILEEGIKAYYAKKIIGNYGQHQNALIYAVAVRQHGDTKEWLDSILTDTSKLHSRLGLNYAMYNLIYRDGIPYETSPQYNWQRVVNITSIVEKLHKAKYDIHGDPLLKARLKRLYDGFLDIVNIGKFTPSVGDSGSVYGKQMGQDRATYQSAYRTYRDRRYLRHLAEFGATGDGSFKFYEDLFYEPLETIKNHSVAQKSRLLDGYGMGILNNPSDTVSVSMYYGYKGGHGHFDRLNFELFSDSQPIMPDLGYPDFMNGYVSGIYTWSKNTSSHNTVTVDSKRQIGNKPGTVNLFIDSEFARVIDVDAAETYPQCSIYQRHMLMVDVDLSHSYFIDIFTVKGGLQHDYSLHGPPGDFHVIGGVWQKQIKGTLAGEDVPIGQIYDDSVRGAKGYRDTFYHYQGSGFQHFFNVRRHQGGDWIAEWSHEKNRDAKLRIRVLDQPNQQVILANAQVSPIKYKQLLTYIIARRKSNNRLYSRFVSVIEPYAREALIRNVKQIGSGNKQTIVLAVELQNGLTDIIVYNPDNSLQLLDSFNIATDAVDTVVRFDNKNKPLQVFFTRAHSLNIDGHEINTPLLVTGRVVRVVPQKSQVYIELDNPSGISGKMIFPGQIVHFKNSDRKVAYTISDIKHDGRYIILTFRDDLLVGRFHLVKVNSRTLHTNSSLFFAPIYNGARVSDINFSQYYKIDNASKGKIHLTEPLPPKSPLQSGSDAWIVNVGLGDKIEIPLGWDIQLGGIVE